MRILSRYMTGEFTRYFLISIAACVSVYLVVDFFENMEMIVTAGAPAWTAVRFFALRLPFILYQGIPAGVLLSTLLTVGMMSRHNEITAMKGAGIDPVRRALVLLGPALVLTGGMYALNDWIVPRANRAAEYVRRVEIKKERILPSFKREGIWFREGKNFYRIALFLPAERALSGIEIFTLGGNFSPEAIVTADRADWRGPRCGGPPAGPADGGGWWCLEGVTERRIAGETVSGYAEIPTRAVVLPYSLDDFTKSEKKPEEMTFSELSLYIARLEASGSAYRSWLPDLHLKVSFPFVCLVMVLVGLPIALLGSGRTSPRGGGSALALTIGVAFALGFSYWVVLAFSVSLGRSGGLPAWLSAWLPNIGFGALGAFLLTRVRR